METCEAVFLSAGKGLQRKIKLGRIILESSERVRVDKTRFQSKKHATPLW